MYDFLVSHWLDVLYGVIVLVFAIVTFVRTGSISKSVSILKEVEELKYRTIDSPREDFKQEFKETITDYILNTATNELEELPVPKNVQAKIQSFLETSLESALERFLPKAKSYEEYCSGLNSIPSEVVEAEYSSTVDDLANLGAAMEIAEQYREDFKLPDTASMADIYAYVDKRAQEIKSLINSKPDVEEGVKPDVEKEEK